MTDKNTTQNIGTVWSKWNNWDQIYLSTETIPQKTKYSVFKTLDLRPQKALMSERWETEQMSPQSTPANCLRVSRPWSREWKLRHTPS